MSHTDSMPYDDLVPDTLAKKMFVLVMLGVAAYVGAVIALLSSAD